MHCNDFITNTLNKTGPAWPAYTYKEGFLTLYLSGGDYFVFDVCNKIIVEKKLHYTKSNILDEIDYEILLKIYKRLTTKEPSLDEVERNKLRIIPKRLSKKDKEQISKYKYLMKK